MNEEKVQTSNIAQRGNLKRIDSLQSLRTMAFMGIFMSHCNVINWGGAWGVSVFFVLARPVSAGDFESALFPFGTASNI